MSRFIEVTSADDKQLLIEAVDRALNSWSTYAPGLPLFRSTLRRARQLPPANVPDDMITMNSRFVITDDRTGQTLCYTLVFPEEQAEQYGKLSVLSPMGMTLFGARVGDDVVWMSASGPRLATVQQLLYQPESAQYQTPSRLQTCSLPELFLG